MKQNMVAFRVHTPEISKVIQKMAFQFGFSWAHKQSAHYTEQEVLYFDSNDMSLTYSSMEYATEQHNNKLVSLDQLVEFFHSKSRKLITEGSFIEILTKLLQKEGDFIVSPNGQHLHIYNNILKNMEPDEPWVLDTSLWGSDEWKLFKNL